MGAGINLYSYPPAGVGANEERKPAYYHVMS